ncbi:30S ribosomal protein S11 [Candidatus Beckwithbacteria bacterium CG22_combo_CG10-13_8_21_14_all_01_47_9]|nr:MAG: 30S ribosomal protein S11 [Candidatus Beckwithbacteria bacterium CG23_combo_of_CG06-09_8_20_14_all_47_9]PIP87641.1 MAG: 30S ribosomal protein S11 [Candidatus Beckwithbacteria bacterium CG22_combo_CG10-13_8_21_14_all_01_47_9]PJA22064.1 MAG: 30S ribosomal protein S11 [Candidatus Beckwithbacteria bacterium CG_4_10_14_0_2_um_filter_47_25]PJC66527.1 MAG: 30S ribosomal protein S11 [Candidatus Beckwithbacteria bacterium CG_4_9_14_0_2_um_filter_47_11]
MAKATPKTLSTGRIYITATFNNTLVTVTDQTGQVMFWGSTGLAGFKGARKSTPYAATTAIENTLKKAKEAGLTTAQVFIKGPGSGRDAVLGVVRSLGLKITTLADISPMAHNGPRPQKRRKGK